MRENIRLSFQGIWSHKMRSFLTMLGIIIGIASIISIVSTIQGTNEQIQKNLIGAGTNLVKIQLYQNDWVYDATYQGIPEGIPVVDDATLEEIVALETVDNAALFMSRNMGNELFYNNTAISGANLLGIDNNYLRTTDYILDRGRLFVEDDYKNFRNVILIDEVMSETIFTEVDPIGQVIEILGTPFTVVGVVKEANEFEPVINNINDYYTFMQSRVGEIFLPDASWPSVFNFDEPESIIVKAASTEAMSTAGKDTEDILNQYVTNTQEIKYRAEDLLQRARELQELSNSANQQLIWIASISLLVGGIGVMNIMLVSVTERTKEIGLKKAIGAPKRKILMQFLTEAAVLTSFGGLLGVGAGIAMAEIISGLTSAPVSINVVTIAIAVLFSMLIGIIFGLIPSVKASNLNPIDALRHE